jgi:hypothetical protein
VANRNRWVVAAVLAIVIPLAGGGVGAAVLAASAYRFRVVSVERGSHPCRESEVNAVNDKRVYGGGVFCGKRVLGFLAKGRRVLATFRVPAHGAYDTYVGSVADDGTAAVLGLESTRRVHYRSYLRRPDGHMIPVRDPKAGSAGTAVTGVNDSGVAVGNYYVGGSRSRSPAFVDLHGKFTMYRPAIDGARDVFLTGVNDRGWMSGGFTDRRGVMHGFVDRGGKVHVITSPAAGHTSGDGTLLSTLANNGSYVGMATNAGKQTAFVHRKGRTVSLAPKGCPGRFLVQGVDDQGTVAGFCASGSVIGYLGTPRR